MRPAPDKKQNRTKSKRSLLAAPHWAFLGVILFIVLILLFSPGVRHIYSPHTLPPESPTEMSLLPCPVGPPRASAVLAGLGAPVPLGNSLGVFN